MARADKMPALPSGVRIVLANCNRILPRKALLEQLRVELLSTGIVDIDVVDPDGKPNRRQRKKNDDRLATLHMYYPQCDDDAGLVQLRISDRLTAKSVERAMDVSDVSKPARPRAVALAIVELLRASWLELVLQPETFDEETGPGPAVRRGLVTRLKEATGDEEEPKTPRAKATDRAAEEQAALERWYRNRLEWTANVRIYPQGGSGVVSTDLALTIPLGKRLRIAVGGRAGGGGISDPLDEVNLFVAGGRLGLVIASSERPVVELQTGLEGGWAQATGSADPSEGGIEKTSSATMTAILSGSLRTQVAKSLDAVIGLQAGFVMANMLVRVTASEDATPEELAWARRVGGILGPALGISLGLSGQL